MGKKTAFDPEAEGGEEESTQAVTEEEESPVKKVKKKVVFDEEPGADPDDIDLESFGKKKKMREGLDSLEDVKEALPEDSEVPAAAEEELDLDNLDDFGSKKKKKKKKDRNL